MTVIEMDAMQSIVSSSKDLKRIDDALEKIAVSLSQIETVNEDNSETLHGIAGVIAVKE